MADIEAGVKPAKPEDPQPTDAATEAAQEEEPLIGTGAGAEATEESPEVKARQFQKRKSPAKSSIHHRSGDGQNRPLSVHYDDDTPKTENKRKESTDNHRFKVDKVSDSDDNHGSDDDEFCGISSYDTKNLKSFKHYTREALPRVDNYRHLNSLHGHATRPTLDELHGVQTTVVFDNKNKSVKSVPAEDIDTSKIVKFGWIQGVLVRCLLNIWGVMLFLRLSWVAAQGGLILGSAVVLLSSVVTVVTTISMSAICTNGEVKNGGTYYMISRSLGPEFGGSIGIIFSLANAIAVAMYTVGFSETVRDLMLTHDAVIFDGGLNDIRLISCITAIVLLAIVFIGTEWESKTQMVLLVILLAAMFDFMVGSVLPPSDFQKSRGFVGWNAQLLKENVQPDFRMEDFFSVFAVFFPAATGILAGANISGDLKNPSHSIPKGTMLAIIITTISYVGFLAIVTATVSRDANGVLELVTNFSSSADPYATYLPLIRNCSLSTTGSCAFGSQNNYQIMELMSYFGPIIYAGIFAATLSSALASLVSAPKVFQALCNDKLFPYIEYFGKGYGVNNEPRRGYLLAFLIAFAFCLMGELNAIAPIISNFFLAAYVIINFSCFHASFAKYPGFRPSYAYYNHWVSLMGAFLTLIVMFILSWSTALVTFVLILALYLWILHRKPDVNWGSSNQAQTYRSAVTSVYRLNQVPDHIKTYRPQVLLLCGNPSTRPSFVDFSYLICKGIGLLTCAQVVTSPISFRVQNIVNRDCTQWLLEKDIKAFYNLVQENSFCQGVKSMIQSYGIGKLRPNIVMLGMKRNWKVCEPTEVLDYFQTFHLILDKHFSLVVVSLPNGMDITDSNADNDNMKNDSLKIYNPRTEQTLFTTKQEKGFIDVWWLFDDGGLTLLLPYIISNQAQWKNCKLRIFALVNKKSELDNEQRNMASLLFKFRINYSDVILITDIMKTPMEKSKEDFNKLIAPYIVDENGERKFSTPPKTNGSARGNNVNNNNTTNANLEIEDNEDLEKMFISESELLQFKDKNNRNIRLRELLNEYSRDSKLIVMTLPMPRKNVCPPVLYMAWLETLTKNMPPMMLMRGNQTDVLTFYS